MLSKLSSWKIVIFAMLVGLSLGTVARLWMRWISTDPEFTWGGTIGIVVVFTIFTSIQAMIYTLRKRVISKRLTLVIRCVGAFFTLPLFTAAGAVMFPTVLLASIATWRKKIDKKVRIALSIISFVIPIIQIKDFGSDFGWNFMTLGRSLIFILIYCVVILMLKPTLMPYEGSDTQVLLANGVK